MTENEMGLRITSSKKLSRAHSERTLPINAEDDDELLYGLKYWLSRQIRSTQIYHHHLNFWFWARCEVLLHVLVIYIQVFLVFTWLNGNDWNSHLALIDWTVRIPVSWNLKDISWKTFYQENRFHSMKYYHSF